eukprot:TRINITY_DN1853_c0_g1_i1.p1 TRINITY_DN1853_c0_g1~~TRINITY_DN1853_c0_g1_i1.p1  ORF type:complete len:164 (+),score=20.47 TRINITY_DN1853_c0_g1_i1:443-934(+)
MAHPTKPSLEGPQAARGPLDVSLEPPRKKQKLDTVKADDSKDKIRPEVADPPTVILPAPVVVRLKRTREKVVQDCDVYIGRRLCMGGWNLQQSKWANPYTVKACGSAEKAVAKFRVYILDRKDLIAQLQELGGQTLGCWCKPSACHGDVLVELYKQFVLHPAK